MVSVSLNLNNGSTRHTEKYMGAPRTIVNAVKRDLASGTYSGGQSWGDFYALNGRDMGMRIILTGGAWAYIINGCAVTYSRFARALRAEMTTKQA